MALVSTVTKNPIGRGISRHIDHIKRGGVMDVLATTDFPDIRLNAAIHSANEGNMPWSFSRRRLHGAFVLENWNKLNNTV